MRNYSSDACTIEADDWVVITGGWYTRTNVTEYDINGWRQEHPDLNTGRYDHGCGYYVNANKEIVRWNILGFVSYFPVQVYLVAGGFYVDENYVRTYLASTEILTNGGSRWMDVEPLPSGAIGLQGVSVDNKIFMTGKSQWTYDFQIFFLFQVARVFVILTPSSVLTLRATAGLWLVTWRISEVFTASVWST